MARQYRNIKKRKDGMYELRFTINGRRYSTYGNTQIECKDKETQIRQDIESGVVNNNITLESYFREYVRQKSQQVKQTTIRDYTYAFGRIRKPLGRMKVKAIERRHVLEFQKELSKECTPVMVNYTMMVLSSIMKNAVIDEVIGKNPCENIPRLRIDKSKVQARDSIHRALTVEETGHFLDEASNKFLYELFVFLFTTGCRVGEAGALRWADIDASGNCIHINRTVTHDIDGKRTEGEPKTVTSKRDIPLMDITKHVLESQETKMEAMGWKRSKADHVFMTVNGKLIDSEIVNQTIVSILKRLDKSGRHIDHFSVHATRDTFATRCIESGMSMNTLKTILGHSSIAMTADLYAHVLPNTKQKEMMQVKTGIIETAQRALT